MFGPVGPALEMRSLIETEEEAKVQPELKRHVWPEIRSCPVKVPLKHRYHKGALSACMCTSKMRIALRCNSSPTAQTGSRRHAAEASTSLLVSTSLELVCIHRVITLLMRDLGSRLLAGRKLILASRPLCLGGTMRNATTQSGLHRVANESLCYT